MKIKVSEAQGPVLDWMVLLARDGATVTLDEDQWIVRDGIADMPLDAYTPSTDWSQGGPIIEREKIDVACVRDNLWEAVLWDGKNHSTVLCRSGPIPLIAAMRCYVASKLGDEVEVPEELA